MGVTLTAVLTHSAALTCLSPSVKHRFGVAVFRFSAFEYEIQRRLKRDALLKTGAMFR
jgi:hypothetical protein